MENKYLNILREIKSVSMSTVSSDGMPQARIIDVMLVENQSLYFCTARGERFLRRITGKQYGCGSGNDEELSNDPLKRQSKTSVRAEALD